MFLRMLFQHVSRCWHPNLSSLRQKWWPEAMRTASPPQEISIVSCVSSFFDWDKITDRAVAQAVCQAVSSARKDKREIRRDKRVGHASGCRLGPVAGRGAPCGEWPALPAAGRSIAPQVPARVCTAWHNGRGRRWSQPRLACADDGL